MKNTRDLILANTFVLLLKNGRDNVSISDIQNKTGISRGLIYKYFSGKSELVFEACKKFFFEEFFADMENMTLGGCVDFLSKNLRRVMRMLSEIAGEKIDVLKYNLLYAEMLMRDERLKAYARKWSEFLGRKVLRRAKKSGEIKDVPDSFVRNVFLDVVGRVSYLGSESGNFDYCDSIVRDMKILYNLLKK
ncbi:MAG: TetR/AcrR family transcriptional regulator [Opitutales bacterium]|nr:TetR/AcrR family transcriptional regulator [Opitutales bacterium]